MDKHTQKLLTAWVIFVLIVAGFVCVTKFMHHFYNDHSSNYRYRILINKDIAKEDLQEEKPLSDTKGSPDSEEKSEKAITESPADNKSAIEEKLYEVTKYGNLPRISPDGLTAIDVFSSKTVSSPLKKIGVVVLIDDIDAENLKKVLAHLGGLKITFVLPAYIDDVEDVSKILVENGHEFLLQIPTQSSVPNDKSDKVSLFFANTSQDELIDKMSKLLACTCKYIGVANTSSTLLTKSLKDMDIITDELAKRGLIFLDTESNNTLIKELAIKNNGHYMSVKDKYSGSLAKDNSSGDSAKIKSICVDIRMLSVFLKDFAEKYRGYVLVPITSVLRK